MRGSGRWVGAKADANRFVPAPQKVEIPGFGPKRLVLGFTKGDRSILLYTVPFGFLTSDLRPPLRKSPFSALRYRHHRLVTELVSDILE